MSEWKEVVLEDITSRIGDGLHGTPKYDTNGDYFFINGNNLKDGKILIKPDTKKVSKEEAIKHERPLSDRTLLLSINGTIGNLAYYNSEKCMLGKSACYINMHEDVSVPFMYYHFLSEEFQFYIEMVATGTTIPNVPLKGIRQYTFNLPSQPEQELIADVLSSIDDKIDLLNRQNQTLEQMAETIFRKWFVEKFENANYVKLGQLVDTIDNRGKTPPWSEVKTKYPLIEVNALGERLVDYSKIRKYVDKETFSTWFRAHPKKYDTLLSTVGSIGEFSMFLVERGSIAQNVVAFQANEISPFYLYQSLKFFRRDIKEFDIGSVQPSIKVSHLREYEIPVFDNPDLLEKFDTLSKDISSKQEFNYVQIEGLISLRNSLLPKLMSGEIKLSVNG